jgi:hypothetical protein
MILATTQYVTSQGVEGLKLGIIVLLLKVYINVIQITCNEFDVITKPHTNFSLL